jgi:glycosyltransferase involved in cell wall biosynthesis
MKLGEHFADCVSIIIPAYNEEDGLAPVVENISKELEKAGLEFEIIVVNDGSTDGTAAAAQRTPAIVVSHDCNRGYGAALKTGIRTAKYDLICIMDADGTYPADQLARLVAEARDADMVVGARTKGAVKIPLVRRPAKWVLNKLANFMTNTKIPDLNSGMRVIRRSLALAYMDILPDRFSFTTTITLSSLCDGYRVKFIPVEYHRRVGRSKIKPIDALNFLILILRTMTYFRPLRIFIPVALLLFGLGSIKFCIDFFYDRLSGTSVLLLLGSLNTMAIGILADMLCFVRRRLKPLGEKEDVALERRNRGPMSPEASVANGNRGVLDEVESASDSSR